MFNVQNDAKCPRKFEKYSKKKKKRFFHEFIKNFKKGKIEKSPRTKIIYNK